MQPLIHPTHVQRDFLKFTAQKIKLDLQKTKPALLENFRSDTNDRTYHPDSYRDWKRRALSIELRTNKVYNQKLEYLPGGLPIGALHRWAGRLGISYSSPGLTKNQWLVKEKHQPRRKRYRVKPGTTNFLFINKQTYPYINIVPSLTSLMSPRVPTRGLSLIQNLFKNRCRVQWLVKENPGANRRPLIPGYQQLHK
jgi:hypothetical protein